MGCGSGGAGPALAVAAPVAAVSAIGSGPQAEGDEIEVAQFQRWSEALEGQVGGDFGGSNKTLTGEKLVARRRVTHPLFEPHQVVKVNHFTQTAVVFHDFETLRVFGQEQHLAIGF